jgi:hypothetical protein
MGIYLEEWSGLSSLLVFVSLLFANFPRMFVTCLYVELLQKFTGRFFSSREKAAVTCVMLYKVMDCEI